MSKNNKKIPGRKKRKAGGLPRNTILLIAMSVGLVIVITVLIILLNVWNSKPENQPPESTPTKESTAEATAEPTAEPEPEPVITDVDFGSSDYSREFFADDLFIGDSIAVGLSDYSKLDSKNVAASVNLTPYKAHAESIALPDGTSGTALDYAREMKPDRIFLILGFNGLNSPNAMQGSFRELTEKLETACPNSVIYICSITPVTAGSSAASSAGITNESITSFNDYLRTMCGELGAVYLDLNTKMSDENGCLKQDYNEVDGMHLTSATYEVILSYIQNYISAMPEPEPSSKHIPDAQPPASAPESEPEQTTAPEQSAEEPAGSQPEQSSGLSSDYNKEFFADDLFIGDSITTGLSAYGILSPGNVAASVGYTPYKAYNNEIALGDGSTGTAFDYAVSMQPKRIFIMLGSNGITEASAMEDSYRTLLDKLEKKCPDSTVYLISVTPVTSDSSAAANAGISNSMITSFNEYIKSLADEKGLTYIDLYSVLSDDNGYFLHEYAENDGLHFKGATYKVMLSYIEGLI